MRIGNVYLMSMTVIGLLVSWTGVESSLSVIPGQGVQDLLSPSELPSSLGSSLGLSPSSQASSGGGGGGEEEKTVPSQAHIHSGTGKARITVDELGTLRWLSELLASGIPDQVVQSLEILEDALHHIDIASAFASSFQGLANLNALLNYSSIAMGQVEAAGSEHSSDLDIQAQSALVLGICFSNNPIAQSQPGLLDSLESILALLQRKITLASRNEEEAVVAPPPSSSILLTNRLLFALSSAIHSHLNNTYRFLELDGPTILLGTAKVHESEHPHIATRIMGILLDSLDNRFFAPQPQESDDLTGSPPSSSSSIPTVPKTFDDLMDKFPVSAVEYICKVLLRQDFTAGAEKEKRDQLNVQASDIGLCSPTWGQTRRMIRDDVDKSSDLPFVPNEGNHENEDL